MSQALEEAIRHLGADSGTIHLKQNGRQVLELAASHAIPEPVLAIVREVPWGKGMAGLAAERARPVDACNIQTTTSSDVRPGARATGLQGALVVPMMRAGQVVGTLGVGCRGERVFTPEETEWLLDFGRRLAESLPQA
jgi:signal transduction protein with GAF and PtsI domain